MLLLGKIEIEKSYKYDQGGISRGIMNSSSVNNTHDDGDLCDLYTPCTQCTVYQKKILVLEAENTKLREWKERAISEYNPTCCENCDEFVEGRANGMCCGVCSKPSCGKCWDEQYETVRRPDSDPLDTFEVCHGCVKPVCGTCAAPHIQIFCPKKNCEMGFCSMECYQTHCKKVDEANTGK